ncbi:MAG TPA: biotin--[acetyl-CoA-carboxylase] ligase [Actinomycetota bacterium]
MPKPTGFREAFERALDGISPRAVVIEVTGSTNDDARALGREGAPHLTVVVTNEQRAGRGRLGRAWVAPPGTSLLASWVARPALPVERWPLVPLLAGVAAAEAIEARTNVAPSLKWPNDLLAGERKLGGILVEAELPAFVVVGLGVNVGQTSFPTGLAATSIAMEGGVRLDRADLMAATLAAFQRALEEPEAALDRYRARCATLGTTVRVERTAAEPVQGVARAIDEIGGLVVEAATGEVTVTAGDVIHLR